MVFFIRLASNLFSIANYMASSLGWPILTSTTGGLNMTVDCNAYKFIGPNETLDYTTGFSGLGIAG